MLLYALLCGFLPFDDENTFKLYKLIQVCVEAYIHFLYKCIVAGHF